MHRRTFLSSMAATACSSAFIQPSSASGLQSDIAILRQALQLHPGLHRYSTQDEIEARLTALGPAFVNAPDQATRYLVLSRFLATIRCGHTYANFLNQTRATAANLFDRQTRLPFRFRWLDRRMIVTADPEHLNLAPGTEIVSINGRPAADILDILMPYARADGHNDAKRRALLDVQGFDRIEYFDVFHGLVFGSPPGAVHKLELRTLDGRQTIREVPALGLDQRRAEMGAPPSENAPLWDWRVDANGIAILTMPTWAVYDSRWDWRRWLADHLDHLKDMRGLIVDLRANEGGEDCGHPILARLAQRPVQIAGSERRVRFRTTPPSLDPYLDTWDNSFRKLGVGAESVGNGFFRLPEESGVSVIPPIAPHFPGRVAILVGPSCSSATFQFALLAQTNGLARLFGEPTGGSQRGINGGSFFFVRLPASGLEFDLPLVGFFPPGNPPDAGLNPDTQIAPTRPDIAAGTDPVVTAAKRWLTAA